ncbi:hypothetical protein [Variovorax beijingensis]|uniref:hypothetical protein n=1 Tax=Variovorax beijingensis TaxID=2496117 RepID=UPI003F6A2454
MRQQFMQDVQRCAPGVEQRQGMVLAVVLPLSGDDPQRAAGIQLCLAEMKDPVKDKLKRFGLFERLGEAAFFPTLGASVSGYLETHPVDWVDWEDKGR